MTANDIQDPLAAHDGTVTQPLISPAADSVDAVAVAVVRRYLDEVVNGGSLTALREVWAEDGQWHGGSMGDRDGLQAMIASASGDGAGAFSDMHLTIDDIVSVGGKVAVRFTNRGRQTGPFLGAPATGKHAAWLGIGVYTVTGAKISEAWFGEDILGMLLQLGVVTLPSRVSGGASVGSSSSRNRRSCRQGVSG